MCELCSEPFDPNQRSNITCQLATRPHPPTYWHHFSSFFFLNLSERSRSYQVASAAMCEEATRSRVLVVGATGRLGGCLVRASLAAGHPTFALVRPHHLAVPDSAPLTSLAGATVVKVTTSAAFREPPRPPPFHLPIDGESLRSTSVFQCLNLWSCGLGIARRLPEPAGSGAAGGCRHLRRAHEASARAEASDSGY